jgi:hypothetical protein
MKKSGSLWKAILWFIFGLVIGWLLGRVSPILAHDSDGEWGNWKDTSICQQLNCGNSDGIKTQSRTCEYDNGENECKPEKWECPTSSVPYTSNDSSKECKKWFSNHWHYTDKVKTQEADTETREIKCEVAEPTQCEEEGVCPTECGLEASEIPDGKGGYKICEATSACVIPTPEPQRSVSEASAPQCGDVAPVLLPANPLV